MPKTRYKKISRTRNEQTVDIADAAQVREVLTDVQLQVLSLEEYRILTTALTDLGFKLDDVMVREVHYGNTGFDHYVVELTTIDFMGTKVTRQKPVRLPSVKATMIFQMLKDLGLDATTFSPIGFSLFAYGDTAGTMFVRGFKK